MQPHQRTSPFTELSLSLRKEDFCLFLYTLQLKMKILVNKGRKNTEFQNRLQCILKFSSVKGITVVYLLFENFLKTKILKML